MRTCFPASVEEPPEDAPAAGSDKAVHEVAEFTFTLPGCKVEWTPMTASALLEHGLDPARWNAGICRQRCKTRRVFSCKRCRSKFWSFAAAGRHAEGVLSTCA